jgi:HD domain
LSRTRTAIRASHERWDGRGYPDGLRGESSPVASRISFVCDAFDAMVSDRPYRRTLSVAEALDEIQREAGRQFCPVAARALVAVVSPPGACSAGRGDGRGSPRRGPLRAARSGPPASAQPVPRVRRRAALRSWARSDAPKAPGAPP